jgi:hypothetical protein
MASKGLPFNLWMERSVSEVSWEARITFRNLHGEKLPHPVIPHPISRFAAPEFGGRIYQKKHFPHYFKSKGEPIA